MSIWPYESTPKGNGLRRPDGWRLPSPPTTPSHPNIAPRIYTESRTNDSGSSHPDSSRGTAGGSRH
jgi:hypothetical protein